MRLPPATHHLSVGSDATFAPGEVSDVDVVHHAVHPLALLAATNASVEAALSEAACRSLRSFAPEGAGVLRRPAVT